MDGAPKPASARHLLAVGAIVLLSAGALVALMLVLVGGRGTPAASGESASGGKQPTAAPSEDSAGYMASGEPEFGSLDEMVATSTLVATGTVTDTTPRVIKPEYKPEEMGLPTLTVEVKVDEVLKGDVPEGSTVAVRTLEFGWDSPNKKEWRRPGERVLLFMSPSTDVPGAYIPVITNYSQSAYLLQDGELVATTEEPLNKRVASRTLPELKRDVEEAKEKAKSGEVKPQKREL